MAANGKAFLVIRRPDGLGNVFALQPGKRYVLGRAKTNEIVLNDDLCSRQHAEVFLADGGWMVSDFGSLNGTRVNGATIEREMRLTPGDEVGVGQSRLIFVHDLGQLPPVVHHPHGGGEGKTSGGRNPVTPWGQPTRGYKTRRNKRTDRFIVSRRRGRK